MKCWSHLRPALPPVYAWVPLFRQTNKVQCCHYSDGVRSLKGLTPERPVFKPDLLWFCLPLGHGKLRSHPTAERQESRDCLTGNTLQPEATVSTSTESLLITSYKIQISDVMQRTNETSRFANFCLFESHVSSKISFELILYIKRITLHAIMCVILPI